MNSSLTIWLCIAFYSAIVLLSLRERNWWRALYFVAAILISLSVLGMQGTFARDRR